jgi:hypothetical protein
MIKSPEQIIYRRTSNFNLIKAIYDKPIANIIPNGEKKTKSISSKIKNKTPTLTALIQYSTRNVIKAVGK